MFLGFNEGEGASGRGAGGPHYLTPPCVCVSVFVHISGPGVFDVVLTVTALMYVYCPPPLSLTHTQNKDLL